MTAADSARYYRAHRDEVLVRRRVWYHRNKAKLARKRRTPEFRARRAAYMRSYRLENF